LKQIHETWPKDVRIVLHNRPLDFHDRALPAAKAAMAASQQGKFWEYHDLLFEQKKFADADLLGYAKQLGLDVLRWKQDKDSKKTADLIAKQDQACVKIGASGTPAFFVNGRSLSGAKPFEDFKPLIEEELKKAQDELAKGVDRKRIYQHMLEIGAKAAPGGGEEKALDRSVARRIDTKGAPSMGPENAVAKLVIFSDFQ